MADVWVRFDKHAPESWPVGAFLPSWVPPTAPGDASSGPRFFGAGAASRHGIVTSASAARHAVDRTAQP